MITRKGKMIEAIEVFVANLGNLLPFGYAFGAGMVTTVSPCGIAMLPVYISFFLGAKEEGPTLKRGARALAMSGVVTLSFVAFFGIIGAIISLGGRFLVPIIPWVAVIIGVALIILGIYLLTGGHLYTNLPARWASRLGKNGGLGITVWVKTVVWASRVSLSLVSPME
jgi:cytochrome c biogenesis protein CcdA